jgi:hypothetical protein
MESREEREADRRRRMEYRVCSLLDISIFQADK